MTSNSTVKELICTVCPKGCHLQVDTANDSAVRGHNCEKGVEYARREISDPRRTLTSTVRFRPSSTCKCPELRRLPVKTNAPIPKGEMLRAMALLNDIELTPPVHVGDVVLTDILGLGVHFVATRGVE